MKLRVRHASGEGGGKLDDELDTLERAR